MGAFKSMDATPMTIDERQRRLPRQEVSWTRMPLSNRTEGCRLEPCRVALERFRPRRREGLQGDPNSIFSTTQGTGSHRVGRPQRPCIGGPHIGR